MSLISKIVPTTVSARRFKWLISVFPPFLGAGIRVDYVSEDFSSARVKMHLRFYNANYWGTHFGGSLTSMTDPFFALLTIARLGPGYYVWDKAAETVFVAPGKGTVYATFHVTDAVIEQIKADTADGSKALPWFETEVVDAEGNVIAQVRRQLYVRRKQRD